MKKYTLLVVLLLSAAVVAWPAGAADKIPTVKEIMGKLNKPGGLRPNLGQDLKADEQDWDEIQRQTKEFVALAQAMAKNTPAIGDAASWQRLTAAYAADAAALDAAAKNKNKAAAAAAHAKLSADTLCKGCHSVHQKK